MSESKQERSVNFYTNMIYFFVMVCLVVMRVLNHYNLFSFLGEYSSFFVSLFTQVGLIVFLPLFILKLLTKSKTQDLTRFCCYRKVSCKVVIASFLLGIVVFFLNGFVSGFFNNIITFFGYKSPFSHGGTGASWTGFVLSIIGTAILPAFCEETLHRGMLLNGNSMSGMKKSILISGLLFGLLHMNIEQFFYATVIGFLLGYLCWGCSSIWPCIIIHFMNNFLNVFFSFATAKKWAVARLFNGIEEYIIGNKILGIMLLVLILIFLVFVGFELVRFLFRETFRYNFAGRQQELANMAIRETFLQSVEDIKNEKEPQQSPSNTDFSTRIIDEKEFFNFVNENLETIIRNSAAEMEKEQKFKPDIKSKIFLWGAIALGAIVTVMTFIWGLLL